MSDPDLTLHVHIPGQAVAPDLLGVWQTVPGNPPADPGLEPSVLWQADLPQEPLAAASDLQYRQLIIHHNQQALPEIEARLDALMPVLQSDQPGRSYALQPPAERELLAWLEGPQAGLAYGKIDDLSAKIAAVTREIQAFIRQVEQVVARFALVHSRSRGQNIGRTRVSWTGNFQTVWRPDLPSGAAALHSQVVALALATRRTWIRLAALVAAGAARIAIVASGPQAAVFAIPAMWRFVSLVLDSYRLVRDVE